MPPRPPRGLRLALLAASLAACARRPAYEGARYEGHGLAFRTGPPPPSWSRLEANYGLLAFRNDELGASVLVNGRCGRDSDDVPLSALTKHLFLQFTERRVDEERILPFDGREAQQTLMTAKLDGVPQRFEAYVMKKNGCVYDFVLVSQPAGFDRARPAFERFVSGFHTEAP